MSRIRQFVLQYRAELWCLVAVFTAGLITHWPLCASYQHWNDIGYHSHMAQLLQEHWRLPIWDERWRSGIVVNYPVLWPMVLALGSALSGMTIWEIYPYLQVVVWALVPCSVFVLVRAVTGHRLGAFLAAGFALYPCIIPDQAAYIFSAAVFPLAILFFLRLLRTPSAANAIWMGVFTGLLFHTHGTTFQFIVITFAVTMVVVLILLAVGGYSIDGQSRFVTLYKLVRLLALSVLVFFAITSYWWIVSLTYYKRGVFHTPLHAIPKEILELISEGWTLPGVYGANNVLLGALIMSILIMLLRCRGIGRSLRPYKIEYIYVVVFTGLGICCYAPMDTLGYSLSVPYKYSLFIHFASWIVCGLTIGAGMERLWGYPTPDNTGERLRGRLKWAAAVAVLSAFVIYTTAATRDWVYRGEVEYAKSLAFPFPNFDTNLAAMKWLDSHARPGEVIAARTTLSTWLLYFVRDIHTLGGHYGGTNPDVQRDRALNMILYSNDHNATRNAVRRYDVTYIYLDLRNSGGGFAYEDSERWYKFFGGYNVHKLLDMYDAVYSADGVMIIRTTTDDEGSDGTERFTGTWRQKIRDMPDDAEIRSRDVFSEDFSDLHGWEFSRSVDDDETWGLEETGDSVRMWMISSLANRDEEVFAAATFDPESSVTVAWERMTTLKVRFRVSDSLTKLHLAVQIGSRWSDMHISAESFTTQSIFLPMYGQGKLNGIHWGVWESHADSGKHWVEVDSITIQ